MGFSLLTPWFLAGLAAIAVPILVHLVHRERKDVVPFPSLMFLNRIPYQAVRRQTIRHWLLFVLRCLAIILLALAFARPFFGTGAAAAAAAGPGAREVVILIDRSYSMGYGDRWSKALGAARNAVAAVAPDDRATIVFFDHNASAASERTSDQTTLTAALGAAKLGSGITRYDPGLRLAQRILDESDLPRREVVLITDFQRIGWDGREGARLPKGTKLTRVDLSEPRTSNVAVTGVEFRRDYGDGTGAGARPEDERERVAVSARLTNKSSEPIARYGVKLDIGGREVESKTVRLDANSAATVDFAPVALPAGESRGTVRGDPDKLPADNVFHFVIARGDAVQVLLVEHQDAGAGRSVFLSRALGIGDRPNFRVQVKRTTQLSVADVSDRALIVLNDAGFPAGEVGRRIRDHVQRGGGLIVALGDRSAPRTWPAYASELVPLPSAELIDRSADRGGTIGYLDRSHPALELFGAPRSGDFSAARFYRYRAVKAAAGEHELARFDDGNAALIERRVGRGRVLLLTSGLDGVWNDLPLQPVFLPFIHQLAKHAAAYSERRAWSTVGQALDLASLEVARNRTGQSAPPGSETAAQAVPRTPRVIVTPSGARVRVGAAGEARALEVAEPGFYEVRRAGDLTSAPRVVAANLDLTESDLSSLDPEQLASAVTSRADAAELAAQAEAMSPADAERRQTLWWYLLVGALALLAVETTLSNRLSRAAR